MTIPNIRAAKEHEAIANHDSYTIACCVCKRPMWKVTVKEEYGTRFAALKEPYEGVPDYDEMCNRKADTIETSCPFCGEDWFQAVQAPVLDNEGNPIKGKFQYFIIPTILELL